MQINFPQKYTLLSTPSASHEHSSETTGRIRPEAAATGGQDPRRFAWESPGRHCGAFPELEFVETTFVALLEVVKNLIRFPGRSRDGRFQHSPTEEGSLGKRGGCAFTSESPEPLWSGDPKGEEGEPRVQRSAEVERGARFRSMGRGRDAPARSSARL